jgi:hypothetical protein
MPSQASPTSLQSRANPPLGTAPVNPLHFVPPTARELRGESVQRLQVGLFGLAMMLLLVGLANIIMDRARMADVAAGGAPAASASADAGLKTDPLADIGVVPSADGGATNSPAPAPGNAPL